MSACSPCTDPQPNCQFAIASAGGSFNSRTRKAPRAPRRMSFNLNVIHPADKVLNALGVRAEDVVVDFGCGPGHFTIPLAKRAKRVIGIDVQARKLEGAKKRAEDDGVKVELYRSDGRSIPLPNAIADLIFLRRVYHELDDKQAVLKELARLMKPGGRLAIMEKTKGLMPIGPPRVGIPEIEDSMGNAGLDVSDRIAMGNETIIIGRRAKASG